MAFWGYLWWVGLGPLSKEVGPGRFLIFCYAKHTKELLCSAEARQAILMKRLSPSRLSGKDFETKDEAMSFQVTRS